MSTLETKQDTSDFDVSVQILRSNTSLIHEVAPQIGSLPSNLQFGSNYSANLQVGSLPTGLQLGAEQLPGLPPSLAAYRSHRNSLSWEEASVYESDRPLSRLTPVESPSDCQELEEEGSVTYLDSPDYYHDLQTESPVGNGNYSCEECVESFDQLYHLKLHEQTHTGESPFQCHVSGCVKSFSSKFKLKRHLLIHSQTKTFTCDTCNRAFRRKDHLKNHEKVHDPSKIVYVCSYDNCSRTYNSLSSFKKHQAMHSAEEGQLDCKICKTILPNQEEVMNHLKIHSTSRVPKGTQDKKFECPQCIKKFPTKKDLKRHSVVHTGQREFACQHCSARFGRKDHMTRHAKKTHPEFFPEGVDRRLASTPTPVLASGSNSTKIEAAKNSRKERSISDPGPVQSAAITCPSPSTSAALHRPLVSPSGMLPQFQRLATADSNINNQQQSLSSVHSTSTVNGRVIYDNDMTFKQDDYLKKTHESIPYPSNTLSQPASVSVIVPPQRNQVFHHSALQTINQHEEFFTCTPKQETMDNYFEGNAVDINDVKQEFLTAESAMKEFMEEKDKMDMVSYFKTINSEFFPIIKDEPKSRPNTPSNTIPHIQTAVQTTQNFQNLNGLQQDQQNQERFSSSLPNQKYIVKQSFVRTQSQDTITRTKNPVLPSVYTESNLIVPEPKQMRYSVHDPFSLFGDESQQFLTDDDSQNYFQPMNS